MTMSNTHSAPAATEKSTKLRDTALLGGLFVLVLIGLGALAAATGWDDTKLQLSKLGLVQVSVLLGLSLVNYIFRGLRWHILGRRLGLNLRVVQSLRHFLGGFAMTVTPGRVGELIRMRWIGRETGWVFARTAPLVLVDRASDVAAMALLLALGITLGTGGIAYAMPVAIIAMLAAIAVTRPALLVLLTETVYKVTGKLPRLMVRIRRAARSLRLFSHPETLTVVLALSMIGWLAEGYAFHLLLLWMGTDIGVWMAVTIFIFSTMAGGLTGAPGGIGGAEAAMVALLSLQGVPLEVSVPTTAVIRITSLWFAILIGLAVFPFAEKLSLAATRDTD
jgi:uncharacterized protein (TIRG00374 family)